MSIGFVIGNGSSRSHFDLRNLFGVGVTYGCNAVHRQTSIHNVICTDRNHLVEALEWQVNVKQYLWTKQNLVQLLKNPTIEVLPDIPFPSKTKNDIHDKWKTISYATLIAAQRHDTIIFIGADFTGNSIFSETVNYPPEMFKDFAPHIEQVLKIISHYEDKQFVFITDKDNDRLNPFLTKSNVSIDNYSNLESMLLT